MAVKTHNRELLIWPQTRVAFAHRAVEVPGEENHAGPHGAIEVEHQRGSHAKGNPQVQVRCQGQRADKRRDPDQPVLGFNAPSCRQRLDAHQANDSGDNNNGQRSLRQIVQQRREPEQSRGDDQRRHDGGKTRPRPALVIDGRPRKRARSRIALEKPANQVGHALADEFLIDIEMLPRPGSEGLGNSHGLHQAEHGQGQGSHEERRQDLHI